MGDKERSYEREACLLDSSSNDFFFLVLRYAKHSDVKISAVGLNTKTLPREELGHDALLY